jgi:hypothetical protein
LTSQSIDNEVYLRGERHGAVEREADEVANMFRGVPVFWRRRAVVLLGVLAVGAGAGVGAYYLVDSLHGNESQPAAPGPNVVIRHQQPQAAQDLGFPAFATNNTTRVAGVDPVADAAGVALAVHPAVGGLEGPAAVSVVEASDWQSGIAAASLAAPPIGAPILLSGTDSVPGLTTDALRALAPGGSAATGGSQLFRIGSPAVPSGFHSTVVPGSDPAQLAAGIDQLRQKLTGRQPRHIVLVGSGQPAFAMPAAAWAARSGDSILFLGRNSAPKPTLDALRRHKGTPVYALGPPSAISDKALQAVTKISGQVKRIGAPDPVQNAIDFARYVDGTFGWDIRDPGHGFVIASDARPLDAAAAAPLSASGDWGPLLLTDDPTNVPAALRGYLLDVKPGYVGDPTRAVYNHIWLLGDQNAISVAFQAQVDDLAELAKVSSGSGGTNPGPSARAPRHQQANPKQP